MKLKRYFVSSMDNYTPSRTFWTRRGALQWRDKHPGVRYAYVWRNGAFVLVGGKWMDGVNPVEVREKLMKNLKPFLK